MPAEADKSRACDREAIFLAALDLAPEERPAYLNRACRGDMQLRRRIEELLEAEQAPEGFLPEQHGTAPAEFPLNLTNRAASLTEQVGDRIGRYKLLEIIGEGGCGVVYMAEQREPVRRRVALKIIKLGMDTRQVVARFEAERQAVAMMNHPNIAKVLDAGATETGRPYFVMELVGGIKITEYCERNHLTTRQRLDLFIQVCRAVQHAHQKGIIHRDLKPSNVLVATHDGVPLPKVIDFGIAKATQGRLTDETVFTAFEQFLGTPAYMSPEQAQAGGLDIDTRSDIYSLGVLLYELLTGRTPFDAKELLAAGLDGMRRTIQDKEPPTPSTRVKETRLAVPSEGSPEAARRAPHSTIDKDLDWIVMKCLEKDRSRRYETANGLAMDVERHLSNEPVAAGPPSHLYRLQKAFRRNKTTFLSAIVVATVLICGTAVSVWQAVRATQAKVQVLAEKQRADDEAAKQEAINRFLNEMLASADPYEISAQNHTKGPGVTMLQVVDAATQQVESGSLKDRPGIEAAICQTLGRTYLNLHLPVKAEPLLRKALGLNRRIYGELNENVVGSLKDLVGVPGEQGHLDEAKQLEYQIIAMERKLHGDEHPHVAAAIRRLANTLDDEARSYHVSATFAEAEQKYRQALAMQRRLLPPKSPELIETLESFATFFLSSARNEIETESMLQEAFTIQTNLGGIKHPGTASILRQLAHVRYIKGDYDAAERLDRQATALHRELLGTNHWVVAEDLLDLGDLFQRQGRLAEAEAAYRESVDIRSRVMPGGGDEAWSQRMLADNLKAQGKLGEAVGLYRKLLGYWDRNSRAGGPGSEDYWRMFNELRNALAASGTPVEAENLCREVLQRQRTVLGDTHLAVPATMCALGDYLASRNKRGEAADLYREAHELIPKVNSGRNQLSTVSLRGSLMARRQFMDAETLYERLLEIERRNPEQPNYYLGALLQDYGDLLAGQQRFRAAAEQYLQALPLRRRSEEHSLNWTLRSLGFALYMAGKPKEAEEYVRDSIKHWRSMHQDDDPNGTTWPTRLLADILREQGKLAEAEQCYREAWPGYLKFHNDFSADIVVQSLVDVLRLEGKPADAESALRERLTQERQRLGEKHVKTTTWLLALADCLRLQSKTESATGCYREAIDLLTKSLASELLTVPPINISSLNAGGLGEEAAEVCERVLALTPTNAVWLMDAAWGLVMATEPPEKNCALAVRLAQAAVQISSHDYRAKTVLGAALCRAGDWQGARANLEQAASLDKTDDSRADLFFLAMAQHRLGNPLAARASYSQAVNWMAEHVTADKELVRLRADTEALLGTNASGQ